MQKRCTVPWLVIYIPPRAPSSPALNRASNSGVVPDGSSSGFRRPLSPRPIQVAKVAAAIRVTTGTNQEATASASACRQRGTAAQAQACLSGTCLVPKTQVHAYIVAGLHAQNPCAGPSTGRKATCGTAHAHAQYSQLFVELRRLPAVWGAQAGHPPLQKNNFRIT